ncbi:hypothetical protein [Bythopirellula polymerisocia]|uniref:hypothetical protein n=1 Tax=Bythopirellula polymerisocia TaxID=2528003 RepID=UPI0011B71B79|nr:hypothetical protein [Bythopirellula polymerisocia]
MSSISGGEAFRPKNPKNSPTIVVADGFCLVSLRDQRKWIQGNPNIQIIINDKIYLFAGMRERDIFAADPEHYFPVLDGDSIVTFVESGKRISGSLQYGLTYRDRIYFFCSASELAKFQAQPDRFLNADLVDQGHCVVSKVDEQKLVPGLPETVLTLDGLRYFFASALHRKIFASNLQRYVDSTEATHRDLEVRVGSSEGAGLSHGLDKNPKSVSDYSRIEANPKDTSTSNNSLDSEEDTYVRAAVSGYCPVSIRKQGVWVRGKSRYEATFDGKIYHMAGPEELTQFRDNPVEYLPVLGGDSIVSFADQAVRVPGSAYHPLIAGDRLFLFADAVEKQTFKDNPDLYENADIALSGNCIVTLLEEQREEPGLPDFETLFQGLRYRFTSQITMDQFLAEPEIYVGQHSVAQ